jgi:hypothetical protein
MIVSVLLLAGGSVVADEPRVPKERGWADPLLYRDLARDAMREVQKQEGVEMFLALLQGSTMGPADGWFHAGSCKYDWNWLAAHHHVDAKKGTIRRKDFAGPIDWFDRLDRNNDGVLTKDDFDPAPVAIRVVALPALLQRLLGSGKDGNISKEDWDAFFERAGKGKDRISALDLQKAMRARFESNDSDSPPQSVLLAGLFAGDIGSICEGPKLGQRAPDFTLKTKDGKLTITLSKQLGKKPIVLVFGNYSCAPFRNRYVPIELIKERYGDRVDYLFIYLREAHPTDGWRLTDNDKSGVELKQPRNLAEKTEAAEKCGAALDVSFPILIDDLDDTVGHAYSGMPSRLYLLDKTGRVIYKSGRGPFGFRTFELEQALIMHLLDKPKVDTSTPSEPGR